MQAPVPQSGLPLWLAAQLQQRIQLPIELPFDLQLHGQWNRFPPGRQTARLGRDPHRDGRGPQFHRQNIQRLELRLRQSSIQLPGMQQPLVAAIFQIQLQMAAELSQPGQRQRLRQLQIGLQ